MPTATIPRLPSGEATAPAYRAFLDAIANHGYRGGFSCDLGTRLVHASDNSIYQQLPQAVLQPRDHADVVRIMARLGEARFRGIRVSPRGGGTGTDGSALTDGVVIDLARGLDRIVEIDEGRRLARVQPGVVLGRLNAALRPLGFQFGPTVSPHDRATLGGMIATDAAGKGSRIHGKTGDHVQSLRAVLPGGEVLDARRREAAEVAAIVAAGGRLGDLHREVQATLLEHAEAIEARWPKLERFLSGYTLPRARDPRTGAIDLVPLLCGAEGTLGIVTEATLRIVPLPRARRTAFVGYASFEEAVAAAATLAGGPAAIETIDDTVFALAREDMVWPEIAGRLGDLRGLAAINLVEFEGDDPAEVEARLHRFAAVIATASPRPLAVVPILDEGVRGALWTLRERAVGLLGNLPGERRPVAFVEDCAVPVAKLPEFVRRFRAILDRHGLRYGMYGHADAGCLHVRPALDLRDPADERRVREITDEVVAMLGPLGGVLWGEHGKGFRSRHSEAFFGPEVFAAICRIKRAFDPGNQCNPGKIAVPLGEPTTPLSIEASTRGSIDRGIDPFLQRRHAAAIHCNGNAACQSWDPTLAMCPSLKVTRDPRHSPRGRAILMREWLRRLSEASWRDGGERREPSLLGTPLRMLRRLAGRDDFSHEVHEAMDGCLSCNACGGQCPVKVGVPEFRSEFLHHYRHRYGRPLRDRLIGGLEESLPHLARVAGFANALQAPRLSRWLLRTLLGVVDPPRIARPDLASRLLAIGVRIEPIAAFEPAPPSGTTDEVILLQDAFTTYLDPQAMVATVRLLQILGVRPRVAAYFPSGKGWHVKGYLGRFEAVARANLDRLQRLARSGRPIVGIDPATTLVFREELPKALGLPENARPRVRLLSEFLAAQLAASSPASPAADSTPVRLFGHCTERSMHPAAMEEWRRIFRSFAIDASIERVGCCGMGGSWGHEARHQADSKGIFALSWAARMPQQEREWADLAVTGFSCRSQIARICGRHAASPAELLLARLEGPSLQGPSLQGPSLGSPPRHSAAAALDRHGTQ